jgi:hypothetical protein
MLKYRSQNTGSDWTYCRETNMDGHANGTACENCTAKITDVGNGDRIELFVAACLLENEESVCSEYAGLNSDSKETFASMYRDEESSRGTFHEMPTSVVDLQVADTGVDSVTLSWSAPRQLYHPINSYTVAYRPAGSSDPFLYSNQQVSIEQCKVERECQKTVANFHPQPEWECDTQLDCDGDGAPDLIRRSLNPENAGTEIWLSSSHTTATRTSQPTLAGSRFTYESTTSTAKAACAKMGEYTQAATHGDQISNANIIAKCKPLEKVSMTIGALSGEQYEFKVCTALNVS